MHRDYDYEFKICLLGESQVGKTSVIERYVDNLFPDTTLPTIGVDFKFKYLSSQPDLSTTEATS
jgi:GTPase SAR1 family protein